MVFTNEEKRDMLQIFYNSNCNTTVASNRYYQMYPERQQPDRTLFLRLHRHLGDHGSFNTPRQNYGNRISEVNSQNILREVCVFFKYQLGFHNFSKF